MSSRSPRRIAALVFCSLLVVFPLHAAEPGGGLLEVLLENGSITPDQYESLKAGNDPAGDSSADSSAEAASTDDAASDLPEVSAPPNDEGVSPGIAKAIADALAGKIEEEFPVKASYTSKGFRLETRDGNWQTNLQWRAQLRVTWPTSGDPRSVSNFGAREEVTFQARRLRMKIGGHGFQPWLKYYFEVDLQPTRDSEDDAPGASARVIDWRIDVDKYKAFAIRVGQWKIDYNRERVDSSGRQQFVERSIVNRVFTIDRQVGISFRGHLFEGTPGDLRYYLGIFTGEGRGVANDDNNLMYVGRLQWNFLGRDLTLKQTDVERTEKPTASLAFGVAKHTGVCTRWSSSGCGNLDGFLSPGADTDLNYRQGRYRILQAVQELAFKWQGFSFQQEFHWKRITDRVQDNNVALHKTNLWGGYAQAGYFFHEIIEVVPEELELAFRYAHVREPNPADLLDERKRNEYTAAANWFFNGHNNKLTLDYSYLTLSDDLAREHPQDHRVRFQWDISF